MDELSASLASSRREISNKPACGTIRGRTVELRRRFRRRHDDSDGGRWRSGDVFSGAGDSPLQNNLALSWPQRLVILKDIASALNYLHTGANQVVLHGDIKASNVMLDSDFNGRLGDFGLARFEDHGDSLPGTAAVGTMGYMAPKLTRMRTSTRTDVYAFGAFMLEVTCGRRPLDTKIPAEKRHLIKWVCDCWRRDSIGDAIDTRLGR